MFNLKEEKHLHTDLVLAEDEIKSISHTLKYGELGQYEADIYEEMLYIAKTHKKIAEGALVEFYNRNVNLAELLVA